MSTEEGMEPEFDTGIDFSVRWAQEALSRRKWVALAVFLCVLTGGIGVVKWLPDVYYAYATVLIEHQQIPDQLIRSTVTSSPENRLQTIGEQILSRDRLSELVERLQLYPDRDEDTSMDRLVGRMRSQIFVNLRRDQDAARTRQTTVAFTITYQHGSPGKAAEVANELASLYVEQNARVREEQAAGISDFLSSQVEEAKAALDEQERELSQFKERHIGELPHQQDANLRTLESLNAELQQNLDNQVEVSERRSSLLKQLSGSTTGVSVGEPDAALDRLVEMKQRLAQLRTTYSDKYPDVVRLREEIEVLEASLLDGTSTSAPSDSALEDPYVVAINRGIEEEDQRLRALVNEAERLRASIETYRHRVETAPRVEQEYQLLSRDYDTTMTLYRSLLNRQKEAELAENMEEGQKGGQFKVIEWAVAPNRPAAPNRRMLGLVTIAMAFGCAIGAILLFEYVDPSFHSVDELRSFSEIPILGSIPLIDTPIDRSRRTRRFVLGAVALALGLVAIGFGAYFFADGNASLTSLLAI